MDLNKPIDTIPTVGPAFVQRLEKLNISSIEDLFYHLPFRYEDTSIITDLGSVNVSTGTLFTVKGEIIAIEKIYTRFGKRIVQGVIQDATGSADIVWFNQEFITSIIKVGSTVILSGKLATDSFLRPKFMSPTYEVLKTEASIHLGTLIGIYPETKGLSSKWIRTKIHTVLPQITFSEWLPENIKTKYHLPSLQDAIRAVHFPRSLEEAREGRARLAFDEMLLIQLLMEERRNASKQKIAVPIQATAQDYEKFVSILPFTLTEGQQNAVTDILGDINKPIPMNRLLEGDVGSGKTVVACAAIYIAYKQGISTAIMAPTTILAQQHYQTISKLLGKLSIPQEDIALITGKTKQLQQAKIYIGTQALLFQEDIIDTLGIAIIDEQHRFGVQQRTQLVTKQGNVIHTLTMTATPIPRTLALSVYGDLDVSVISHLPAGRKPIMTRIVPNNKRDDLYSFVQEQISESRQIFIICPLVSLSDKLNVKSATEEFELLRSGIFKNYRLALLHGQLKPAEKDALLDAFKRHEYDILVATPVVEVGIDIPNATVMIIEGAERFGLAQLHQLRGRVGRGEHESFCFLLTSNPIAEEKERLKVFSRESSGLAIAEFDLQNRGPGEVYGVKQSGITQLKAASFQDLSLIQQTKTLAHELIVNGIEKYPTIQGKLESFHEKIHILN